MPKLTPSLWFDDQAEAAAKFYTSVFKNSKIVSTTRYPNAGQEIHGKPAGSVMTVLFELDGQPFTALNGGPQFKFDEAISFEIECDTQQDIDFYWEKLTADGGSPGPCGWVKDKFGLSWQVVPKLLQELGKDTNPEKDARVMAAMMKMGKIDIAALKRAHAGS
ncbi:MAG: VOC family protein [Polyangiales bacterium]